MTISTFFLLVTAIMVQDGPIKNSNLLRQNKALVSAETEPNNESKRPTDSKPSDDQLKAANRELDLLKKGLVETEKEIAKFEKLVGPKDPVLKQLRDKVTQMRSSIKQLESLQSKTDKDKDDMDSKSSTGDSETVSPSNHATSADINKGASQDRPSNKTTITHNDGPNAAKGKPEKNTPPVPLKSQLNRLKQQWAKATNEQEKKEIKKKLLSVLEQQFDRDLKLRDEKLIAAERRLAKLRQQFETMVKSKKKIINTYADATTTSWDHPGILAEALGNGQQPPKPKTDHK